VRLEEIKKYFKKVLPLRKKPSTFALPNDERGIEKEEKGRLRGDELTRKSGIKFINLLGIKMEAQ